MNLAIPLTTAVVALVFALPVLGQYLEHRKPYHLVWAIALGLSGIAVLLQFLWQAGVSSEAVFRLWYVTAVQLVLVYTAGGTACFLFPHGLGRVVTWVLPPLTLAAIVVALVAPVSPNLALLEGGPPHAKDPTTLHLEEPESLYGRKVEGFTFFLSLLSGLVLIGGVASSAVIFLRTRRDPWRVLTAILVALGLFASQEQGLTSLIGLCVVYSGFLLHGEVLSLDRFPLWRQPKPARGQP